MGLTPTGKRRLSTAHTHLGRSAALVIGTQDHAAERSPDHDHCCDPAPGAISIQAGAVAIELRRAIDAQIPADGYFDDVHGTADYKRHLTHYFAEQIRAELAQPERRMNDS